MSITMVLLKDFLAAIFCKRQFQSFIHCTAVLEIRIRNWSAIFWRYGVLIGYWLLSHWKCTGNMAGWPKWILVGQMLKLVRNGQWLTVISSTVAENNSLINTQRYSNILMNKHSFSCINTCTETLCIAIHRYITVSSISRCSYRVVGNFCGLTFCGLESSDDFVGLYFHDLSLSYTATKFSKFSWINRVHKIHENLNPTKITDHTV